MFKNNFFKFKRIGGCEIFLSRPVSRKKSFLSFEKVQQHFFFNYQVSSSLFAPEDKKTIVKKISKMKILWKVEFFLHY